MAKQKKCDHVQSCCFANINKYFLALLVAVATLVTSAPYCCDLKILMSHFSSLFSLWFAREVAKGHPQRRKGKPPAPPPPPPGSLQCRHILAGKSLCMFVLL